MVIDSRQITADKIIDTDICIIGAGAAGITIAREFINQKTHITLLESGGFEYDAETQSLYKGVVVDDRYYPLDISRLRYFGGTTNHWEGACIPLNKIDFEVREWVPHSGWPFSRDHLIPYYKRAHRICEIGPFNYEARYWESEDRPSVELASDRLFNVVYQSSPPTRFGVVYRDDVRKADNIDVYLFANVTDIAANESVSSIQSLKISTLNGNTFSIKAKVYILATGGIENPRILLNANKVQKSGLGNRHDLVGRYFMEHPVTESGLLLPTHFNYRFYSYYMRDYQDGDRKGSVKISGYMAPSEATIRNEKLMSCGIGFSKKDWKDFSEGVVSMRRIIDDLSNGELPDDLMENLENVVTDIDDIAMASYRKVTGKQRELLRVSYWSEQSPNPDSRITLINEKDALEQNEIKLDWRLNNQDRENITRIHEILAEELGRAGLGRLRFDFNRDKKDWMSYFRGSFHHIGTTRMHTDPKKGVVDADCRIHGINNLYIAGSSVFPTSGHANPTLTIIALSLRLSDHIKGALI